MVLCRSEPRSAHPERRHRGSRSVREPPLTVTKSDPQSGGFDEAKLRKRGDAIVETDLRNNPPAFDL
jgi:hypothetical protein